MINESKEGLIQAVAEHTEDVAIKKQAAKRLTAKAKDYSLNFISDKKQVFEEGNQAETLTKRIFRLEDMFLNDDEINKSLFKDSGEFISSSSYYSISNKYKILLLSYLFEHHKNKLTKQQLADAKRFSKAKQELLSEIIKAKAESRKKNDYLIKNSGNEEGLVFAELSSESIFKALKPIFKKSLTQRKAVRIANILFETRRSSAHKNYYFENERNLESYLKELNLDSERILTKISSKADAAKEETSQSKTRTTL
jgi:hypothetical protein